MMPIGGSDTDRDSDTDRRPSLHLILQLTRIENSGSMKLPDVISSPDSKRIKNAAKLLRRRDRKLTGRFVVKVPEAVHVALDRSRSVVQMLIAEVAAWAHREFVTEVKSARIRWNIATAEVLTVLATTVNS